MQQDFTLSNGTLNVKLSNAKTGSISGLSLARSGLNHVGPVPFQAWLKFGKPVDPLCGMVHLFHPDMIGKEVEAKAVSSRVVEMSIATHGVRFDKRFEVHETEPMLAVTLTVTNESAAPEEFQFEPFMNWGFGPLAPRKAVATHWIDLTGKTPTRKVHSTPYGHMAGEAMSAKRAALALCDIDHRETVFIIPDENWLRFSFLSQMGDNWRAPYSDVKRLAQGESFSATYWLYIIDGCAAIDTITSDWMVGLATDDAIYTAGQPIRAAASRAEMAPGLKSILNIAVGCCGTPVPVADETFVRIAPAQGPSITGPIAHGKPGRADSLLATIGAGSVPAGQTVIQADFHYKIDKAPYATSTSTIKTLEAAKAGTGNTIDAGKSPFPVRAAHLILSQQSAAGVTKEHLMWVMDEYLAPSGYNTLILELNKGLRFKSHPELAEPWSLSHEDVRAVVAHGKKIGFEMIPQQNFYGHQTETNLTKVYPHLQEIPGEEWAYCPVHPQTRAIVADQVQELIDIFEPRIFHQGHDEVQFHGRRQFVGVCDRCKAFGKPHEVFAYDVNQINDVVKKNGVRSMIWGDMVTPLKYASLNNNGKLGEVYKAIDLLPRDIMICDWHYYDTEDFGSVEFFINRGLEVWGATWFHPRSMSAFSRLCRDQKARGMIFTTWCRPDPTSLPLEAGYLQAILTANPDQPVTEELHADIRSRAYALWHKWQRRS